MTVAAISYDPLFDLQSRRFVITGGGRGIGLELAVAMLERGAFVEIWEIDKERVDRVRQELDSRFPGRVNGVAIDVSNRRDVEAAVEDAESRGPTDVLINNAGITSRRRPAIDIPQEDWDRMIAVNLTGPWNTCLAFGRRMLTRRRGSVINLASTNSVDPSIGNAHYCVSKAGVGMLTKNLALEWAADGVRVNAVGPGPIQTPATLALLEDAALRARWEAGVPMRRLGVPGDLIGIFIYLSSDASRFATGKTFYVDGGWLL
jgi:NAD(P)-dependent dehydrogenase (short-subunit alcohol dehydrogenase family)